MFHGWIEFRSYLKDFFSCAFNIIAWYMDWITHEYICASVTRVFFMHSEINIFSDSTEHQRGYLSSVIQRDWNLCITVSWYMITEPWISCSTFVRKSPVTGVCPAQTFMLNYFSHAAGLLSKWSLANINFFDSFDQAFTQCRQYNSLSGEGGVCLWSLVFNFYLAYELSIWKHDLKLRQPNSGKVFRGNWYLIGHMSPCLQPKFCLFL